MIEGEHGGGVMGSTTGGQQERRSARGVRDAGWSDTTLRGVNLNSNARGPADHEHLGQGDYVPLFLSPIPPLSHYLTWPILLTYLFAEGT